ncbi:hypothetical protein [Acidovorax sp. ACV01]|uniref:hypothetical protein n=1 Tax=Acidovorax sp. ACV01 TaxID=2769311 RepID=UPI001781ADC2|nr:hypothetical protein [Acidovorax sp. ACV01]MBD9395214.1 hypothetical protein [Acidovorax sp. ACV01]
MKLTHHALWGILLASLLQGCGGGSTSTSTTQSTTKTIHASTIGDDDGNGLAPLDTSLVRTRHAGGAAINLVAFTSDSSDMPTIDLAKRMQKWSPTSKTGAWGSAPYERLDLDANGWVQSLPANPDEAGYASVSSAILDNNSAKSRLTGIYHVYYEGEGDFYIAGASARDFKKVEPGHATFNMLDDAGLSENLFINISKVTPGNHLRNIRILAPGGICGNNRFKWVADSSACVGTSYKSLVELSQTQIWFPNFLGDLSGYRALRFMDWFKTNSSPLATWETRPLKAHYTWNTDYGVPVGMAVNLANTLQADAWLNIPFHASDDYARRLAQLVKQSLNPAAKFIVEYGNEPWNNGYGFSQNYQWLAGQGSEKFNGEGSVHDRVINYYALRSSQLCQIIKQEFGAQSSRVQCVVNQQISVIDPDLPLLRCPLAVKHGHIAGGCASAIDAVAVAPYVGGYLGDREHIAAVETWTHESDGGLSTLFKELRAKDANGNSIADTPLKSPEIPHGAIDQVTSWINGQKAIVSDKNFKKPLFAYEGGQHLAVVTTANAAVTQLFTNANRDARMGDVYRDLMGAWTNANGTAPGQVFTYFNNVYKPGSDGAWGLREAAFDNAASNPKWVAVQPYRENIACWWAQCAP